MKRIMPFLIGLVFGFSICFLLLDAFYLKEKKLTKELQQIINDLPSEKDKEDLDLYEKALIQNFTKDSSKFRRNRGRFIAQKIFKKRIEDYERWRKKMWPNRTFTYLPKSYFVGLDSLDTLRKRIKIFNSKPMTKDSIIGITIHMAILKDTLNFNNGIGEELTVIGKRVDPIITPMRKSRRPVFNNLGIETLSTQRQNSGNLKSTILNESSPCPDECESNQ